MNSRKTTFRNEWRVVPGWSKLLGLLLGAALAAFLFWNFGREPSPPALLFQIFLALFATVILSVLVMLIGYVNRDAGRRGMSRTLWTLVVIFVPNALGFILYFLLRRPLLGACPECGVRVKPEFTFCPRCAARLLPTCPACNQAVSLADQFCTHCGAPVRAGERMASGT